MSSRSKRPYRLSHATSEALYITWRRLMTATVRRIVQGAAAAPSSEIAAICEAPATTRADISTAAPTLMSMLTALTPTMRPKGATPRTIGSASRAPLRSVRQLTDTSASVLRASRAALEDFRASQPLPFAANVGLGQVRSLVVDVADELRQGLVAKHLAHGLVHAGVEPVVVGNAQDEVADQATAAPFATAVVGPKEPLAAQRVEPRVASRRDVGPGGEHLAQLGGRARGAGAKRLVDSRVRRYSLTPGKEVLLLLPGQMADAPADCVQPARPGQGVFLRQVPEAASELAPGIAQLQHRGVRPRLGAHRPTSCIC